MRLDFGTLSRTAGQPLHRQLKELIRDAILSGVYRPGDRLEPERRFVDEGGVSLITVSRALRELADEGYLRRRTGSGTFVCDDLPTIAPKLGTVGVFYYHTASPYFSGLMTGIEEAAQEHNITIESLPTGLSDEGEQRVINDLTDRNVDGIIAVPFARPGMLAALQRALDADIPVVTIGVSIPQLDCDAVTFDNEHGAYLIAEHLLGLGHRRLSFLGVEETYPHTMQHEMLAGIDRACRRFGVSFDPSRIYNVPMAFDEARDTTVHDLVLSIVKPDSTSRTEPSTAIICVADGLARYATQTLAAAGVTIPQDVSITGVGNLPIAEQLDPPLTTMDWPLRRAGHSAVRSLVEQTSGRLRRPQHRILDTGIVVRRSAAMTRLNPR